ALLEYLRGRLECQESYFIGATEYFQHSVALERTKATAVIAHQVVVQNQRILLRLRYLAQAVRRRDLPSGDAAQAECFFDLRRFTFLQLLDENALAGRRRASHNQQFFDAPFVCNGDKAIAVLRRL